MLAGTSGMIETDKTPRRDVKWNMLDRALQRDGFERPRMAVRYVMEAWDQRKDER
jgi:hypothetical protein